APTAVALQSTGAIIVIGAFTSFNGASRIGVVRLSSAGVEDAAFYANIGPIGFMLNYPRAIAVQSDDKFLIGGDVDFLRYNTDGTLDAAFNTNLGTGKGVGGVINGITIQSDGKILVTGSFSTFDGVATGNIIRRNNDGTADTSFSTNIGTGASGPIWTAPRIDSSGRITILGSFNTFDGNTATGIARLSSAGVF